VERKRNRQAKLLKNDCRSMHLWMSSWFESQEDEIKSKAFPILVAHWIVKQGGICCNINGGPVPLAEAIKPQI